ncbi:hypothetical protein BOTBODRAFT_179871 [Botryobasidium botryosum FD-172 SS1]|uniref:F-box domain-containing protein n=1 Tax=Botryobasidium botryosum (strain FD-172 SS1) TaxID=930990 RepID=A0A067M127_BOTB1|nr:hypothetical protein BOTBODRAFT_179871 [Botryobasidium botryosum FD-172 SS1]
MDTNIVSEAVAQALLTKPEDAQNPEGVIEDDIPTCHPAEGAENPPASLEECSAVTHTRDSVAETICNLADKYISMRRQNAQLPIHRLPSEIFIMIFELAVDIGLPSNFPDPMLFTLSQVSSKWRAIALGSPRLWSQIGLFKPSLIDLFLERSNTAPFEVYIAKKYTAIELDEDFDFDDLDIDESEGVGFRLGLSSFSAHLHRCSSITLLGVTNNEFPSLLTFPMPLLETFRCEKTDAVPFSWSEIELPDDFLGNHAPCLRHLHLSDVVLPTDFQLLSGLLSLHLENVSPRLLVAQFVSHLRDCPSLQRLVLRWVEFEDWEETLGSEVVVAPVILPALQDMTISLRLELTRVLLVSVAIPPTACLRMRGHDQLDTLFLGTRDNFPNLSLIRALHFSRNKEVLEALLIGRATLRGPDLFSLFFYAWDHGRNVAEMVRGIISGIATPSSIEAMTFHALDEEWVEVLGFVATLRQLPALTTLWLCSSNPALIHVLVIINIAAWCPHLSELRLSGMAFSNRDLIRLVRGDANDGTPGGNATSLRRVRLANCVELKPETITELEKYVQVQVIDGDPGTCDCC